MFTPTLRCECAQPASDRLMRKWCTGVPLYVKEVKGHVLRSSVILSQVRWKM